MKALSSKPSVLSQFHWGQRTYIMAILNVTPDSFSGDGLDKDLDRILMRARSFVEEGADIIDIGGESTRPGSSAVSVTEEIDRVVPVLELLDRELGVPLSIDTQKYDVALAAIRAGASMINDISGLKEDPRLAEIAAQGNLPIVLAANERGESVNDILKAVVNDLKSAINKCKTVGVPKENIIVDPGIGFGKTVEQNLELIRRLDELKILGYPILLGTSRKSVIGITLNLPTSERLEGTAATVAIGIARGADIIRVHDIKSMVRVARMSDAVVRIKKNND